MPFDPVQVSAGAVLGFLGNGALRWWQYRRDLWISNVERLCDAVNSFSDTAVDYWLTDQPESESDKSDRSAYDKSEIRILGLQSYIDGLLASLVHDFNAKDQQSTKDIINMLTDAAGGGLFGSIGRKRDYDRARLIQNAAAEATLQIRRSAETALTPTGYLSSLNQRRKQKQIDAGVDIADFRSIDQS